MKVWRRAPDQEPYCSACERQVEACVELAQDVECCADCLRRFLGALTPQQLGCLPPSQAEGEPPWGSIDSGIVDVVRLLWRAGFAPTDSGDGYSKAPLDPECELDYPHVHCVLNPHDDPMAMACIMETVIKRSTFSDEPWKVEISGTVQGPWILTAFVPRGSDS